MIPTPSDWTIFSIACLPSRSDTASRNEPRGRDTRRLNRAGSGGSSVGLTEAKAKEQGRELKVGKFPFIGNGKAIALGEPEGFIKTIFDARTGELLGAHMIGAEVTELIQGYSVAKTLETTEADLMATDRKSTRLNSSHVKRSRMPSSA